MIVALPKAKMTADEYLRWSTAQVEGRFELVGGDVIMMMPETVRHVQVKNEIWLALRNAIRRSGVACTAYGDGAGVQIDEETIREPDVSVQCGPAEPLSLLLGAPVIVVEVVSPSSARSDAGAKVAEYFRVQSILHYLIVDPISRAVVIHSRLNADAPISTKIARAGELDLSPPGIRVSIDEFFAEVNR